MGGYLGLGGFHLETIKASMFLSYFFTFCCYLQGDSLSFFEKIPRNSPKTLIKKGVSKYLMLNLFFRQVI